MLPFYLPDLIQFLLIVPTISLNLMKPKTELVNERNVPIWRWIYCWELFIHFLTRNSIILLFVTNLWSLSYCTFHNESYSLSVQMLYTLPTFMFQLRLLYFKVNTLLRLSAKSVECLSIVLYRTILCNKGNTITASHDVDSIAHFITLSLIESLWQYLVYRPTKWKGPFSKTALYNYRVKE